MRFLPKIPIRQICGDIGLPVNERHRRYQQLISDIPSLDVNYDEFAKRAKKFDEMSKTLRHDPIRRDVMFRKYGISNFVNLTKQEQRGTPRSSVCSTCMQR